MGSVPISVSGNTHAMCIVPLPVCMCDLYTVNMYVCVSRRRRQRVPQCSEDCLSEVRPDGQSEHPLPSLLPRHQVLLGATRVPAGQLVGLRLHVCVSK